MQTDHVACRAIRNRYCIFVFTVAIIYRNLSFTGRISKISSPRQRYTIWVPPCTCTSRMPERPAIAIDINLCSMTHHILSLFYYNMGSAEVQCFVSRQPLAVTGGFTPWSFLAFRGPLSSYIAVPEKVKGTECAFLFIWILQAVVL